MVPKTAEATGDSTANKIANKITSAIKNYKNYKAIIQNTW